MARILRVAGAIGAILRPFSLTFLLPVAIAAIYDPWETRLGGLILPRGVIVFAACGAGAYLLGTLLRRAGGGPSLQDLREREAYLTVGLGWLVLCLVAMVPFILDGVLRSPADAFFEAMSGMTTTGATVIAMDLDAVPKSLMIWRAMLQFLGGMGIIVLSVALLARLTKSGLTLMQAEAPGPSVNRIAPRIAHTARILWGVYATMAVVLFGLLFGLILRHGMGVKQTVYEALLHTFTAVSTGGFGAHTASIAYFDDWILEAVIIVFMLLAGTNFTLHYHLLRGRPGNLLRDPEWRFFMATFGVVTLATTGILTRAGHGAVASLRDAAFTSASLITSTGFATADFDAWPEGARYLVLLLLATGATAGSTGGGLKHIRVLLLLKVVARQFRLLLHPRAVIPIRVGGRVVAPATLTATVALFIAFVGMWALVTVALVSEDPALADPVDAASASMSALSNMGPGLGAVGPTRDYSGLTPWSKLLLAFEMWFGRLEVFAALLVFTPETWKK